MQKTLLIKIAVIAGLCAIFAIGLAMIQSLVYERQNYANNVINEIAEQHVKPQQLITPFLVSRYTTTQDCNNDKKISKSDCRKSVITNIPIFANQTEVIQNLTVSDDAYKRSIYSATSYRGDIKINQTYQLNPKFDGNTQPANKNTTSKQQNLNGNNPYLDTRLLLPISDLRGVNKLPNIAINGQTITANYPKNKILNNLEYLEVILPKSLQKADKLTIEVTLNLSGLKSIQTAPLGEQFKLTTKANWRAPNFIGHALPTQKTLKTQDFNANWQNQHLAISNNQLVSLCIKQHQGNCELTQAQTLTNNYNSHTNTYNPQMIDGKVNSNQQAVSLNEFGVDFAKPNNVYLQTERTMKYGLLLIAISFGSIFLFEVIKSLRIHPVQYLLVSMALLVFYALLLSLAEQIAFWQAYLIASLACTSLIGWYAFYLLKSAKRAGLFTLILAAQYAGFYIILTIADMNLLIGAILCFTLIATVMFITRKIDWYKIN
ncbi:MAG: hypothetical protein CSA42_04720 [Gammaproteobacteria bacterium]|nr:MAG: hypothetical protein CSA42_04720 [Gammaproteobacteria bacterium]